MHFDFIEWWEVIKSWLVGGPGNEATKKLLACIHVHFQAFPPSSYYLPYACKLSKTGLWERLATATFWGVDVFYGTSVQTILLWKCLLHRLEIHLSACVFHLGTQSFDNFQ